VDVVDGGRKSTSSTGDAGDAAAAAAAASAIWAAVPRLGKRLLRHFKRLSLTTSFTASVDVGACGVSTLGFCSCAPDFEELQMGQDERFRGDTMPDSARK
jgi:hypothetical protein